MTYSVPYSFVPGTKAKANEVNANFIDVLEKIDTTNNRINDTNSNIEKAKDDINEQINNLDNSKLNLSLGNLNDAGKAVLNNKANASLLDGTWVSKYLSVASKKSIDPNQSQKFDISSYLPDKTYKYEILISIYANTATSTNASFYLSLQTDCLSKIPITRAVTRVNISDHDSGQFVGLTNTGRTITISNSQASVGTSQYTLELFAYRKVR